MIKPIDLDRAYRLLNIGATTLVSAAHEGDADIMAAAWATALDLTPCKATVVIDKSHYTRKLIEKSGFFRSDDSNGSHRSDRHESRYGQQERQSAQA